MFKPLLDHFAPLNDQRTARDKSSTINLVKAPQLPEDNDSLKEQITQVGARVKVKWSAEKIGDLGCVKVVDLRKGPTGLGMQLMGGSDTPNPVTVKEVFPGGPAHKSGKIRAGDVILEANGISFEELNHDEAIKTMKGFSQGKVSIILRDRTATLGRSNPH